MFVPGMVERQVDDVATAPTPTLSVATSVPSTLKVHGDRRAGRQVRVEHAELHGLRLAEDGEARRAVEHDAAVVLVLLAGDERVHRRVEAERGGVLRHVLHDAVGDEHARRRSAPAARRRRAW